MPASILCWNNGGFPLEEWVFFQWSILITECNLSHKTNLVFALWDQLQSLSEKWPLRKVSICRSVHIERGIYKIDDSGTATCKGNIKPKSAHYTRKQLMYECSRYETHLAPTISALTISLPAPDSVPRSQISPYKQKKKYLRQTRSWNWYKIHYRTMFTSVHKLASERVELS